MRKSVYIQLYSPHNMAAQANKTSKNTTNEIEKNWHKLLFNNYSGQS